MSMRNPTEPTSEQCNANAAVPASSPDAKAFACWYPQMGGYGAKCVVEFFPAEDGDDRRGCFEAWVWHDGEFPFDEDSRPGVGPAHIHHCDADQFVRFGQMVAAKQDAEIKS